jgi:hypothetical protein
VSRRLTAGVVVTGLIVLSCGDDDQDSPGPGPEAPASQDGPAVAEVPDGADVVEVGPTAGQLCAGAVLSEDPGSVASPELVEISGVAASRQHDGVLWVHNDSGYPPELFAVGDDGADLGRFTVEGAEAFDWEDLTLGRGPEAGTDYLYVGDIGDNFNEPRRLVTPLRIYRVREPGDRPDGTDRPVPVDETFTVAYVDGHRDAEALMADPVDGTLVIVSKQWDGTVAGAYELPAEVVLAEQAPDDTVLLERVADVPGTEGVFVTGGEVSADGSLIALRTYTEVWLFDRAPDESVTDALAGGADCAVEVDEPQGEAVAFSPTGDGFVTISEGDHQPVNWHLLP